jgi:hypothetical protein
MIVDMYTRYSPSKFYPVNMGHYWDINFFFALTPIRPHVKLCDLLNSPKSTGLEMLALWNFPWMFLSICLTYIKSLIQLIWAILEILRIDQYNPLCVQIYMLTIWTIKNRCRNNDFRSGRIFVAFFQLFFLLRETAHRKWAEIAEFLHP